MRTKTLQIIEPTQRFGFRDLYLHEHKKIYLSKAPSLASSKARYREAERKFSATAISNLLKTQVYKSYRKAFESSVCGQFSLYIVLSYVMWTYFMQQTDDGFECSRNKFIVGGFIVSGKSQDFIGIIGSSTRLEHKP